MSEDGGKMISAWPQQRRPNWHNEAYDRASPVHTAEFAQGGGNYDPATDGPLGPYVVYVELNQAKERVASDWCIGFGLPGNRHVAYQVTFQECLAYEDDVDGEVVEAREDGCGAVLAGLVRLLGG